MKYLKGFAAAEVLQNKKSGFTPDMNTILATKSAVDLLTGEKTASRGIVNVETIKKLLKDYDQLSSEDKNQLFNLAVIEAWMREYLDA